MRSRSKLWMLFLVLMLLEFIRSSHASSAARGAEGLQDNQADSARMEFFEAKVRPLLAANCYGCHSSAQSGGLRLDSRGGLLKGGGSGSAIIPGEPEASLLIQAVSHKHEHLKMPQGKPKLKDEEIDALRQWIKDGAYWPKESASHSPQSAISTHWAFQPIKRQSELAVPITVDRHWPRNEIDRFILVKLEAGGLKPNPPADKRTLLRRVTFGLTGLPPTPEEVSAFVSDQSPAAFAKVINRLLNSPRYGERWGRHWLDVARYADTQGVNDTTILLFPFAYTYRDWVIRAFNEDLPYDQFLTQQIAADLMPKNDPRNLAALGFLTVGRGGGGVSTEEKIDDKVDVVTRGTMALTVSCARCHNHKFDSIPTADYYSLFSIFANTREPQELPLLDPSAANGEKELALKKERDKIDAEIAKYSEKRFPELKADYRTPEKITKYLLATYQARALKTESELQALATEKDHNLYMLRRWQNYLKKAGDNHPVFALWQALSALPEKEFAAQAPAAFAACNDKINPLVAREFAHAPANLAEAAERYGKLIAQFDKAEKLSDSNEEALRRVLHGDDSPINVPFADYGHIRLVKDSQYERDQKQKIERMIIASAFDGAAPRAMAVEDLPHLNPAHIYIRGNPNNQGAEVPRRFLEVLAGANRPTFTHGSGRLELAQAIVDKNNPLTARVIVNRIWQWHFGQGLVRTPSDFGARGDAPTHPELLDYLADWFMQNGWSIKKLHALILSSATYQQSSADNSTAHQRDPENKLLWRMNRQRLDFESLRDALLLTSGQLDTTAGGVAHDITSWPFSRRRTVYAFINRAKLAGEFNTFDFASPDAHVAQRYQTTIPQQSLYLMNSPFVVEQARALVQRPDVVALTSPRQRIRALYRLLYGREATAEEIALGISFVSHDGVRSPAFRRNASDATLPPKGGTANEWQYGQGEYDEAAKKLKSFTQHNFFAGGAWRLNANELDPRRSTALVDRDGGVPGGGKSNAAIRRWVAPFDGKVAISGTLIHDLEQACVSCDGVEGVIISSRAGALGTWTAYLSQASTNVASVEVKRGDTIDFLTHGKKNSGGDDFKWRATIRRLDSTANEKSEWDSARDFYSPLNQPMNAWERYVQALIAAVEFSLID